MFMLFSVQIYKLIRRIFDKARLHAEAVIIALIYIGSLLGAFLRLHV